MDIVSSFNPTRLVQLAGERFWCRAATIEDLATIIAWIDDVIPGWSDREFPPKFGSDLAGDVIESPEGLAMLVWIALRHQGVSYERAAKLSQLVDDDEKARLMTVLFMRRRTLVFSPGAGEDIAHLWWGPLIASLNEYRNMMPGQVGSLSLDQLDMLTTKGCEDEKPGKLTVEQAQAMWEAAQTPKGNGEPCQN